VKLSRFVILVTAIGHSQPGSERGQIKLITHKGFGFIGNGGSKDLFFHRSAVESTRLEDLSQGQQVSFTVGQSPRGPCATNVQVI